jgi:hypothetical protein
MDILFQHLVSEVVAIPLVSLPLLVFGFIVYQEVISEVAALYSPFAYFYWSFVNL